MGFLKIGTPLSWEDVQNVKSLIRLYGILQFVHSYKCNKDRKDEHIMFGDEIEYIIIRNDDKLKEASALLCATDLIDEMMNLESGNDCQYGSHWTPEYSSFTIEGTPSVPFKFELNSSYFIEHCMKIRRNKLNNVLSGLRGVQAITLPCYPNVLLNNSLIMAKKINLEKKKKKINKQEIVETSPINYNCIQINKTIHDSESCDENEPRKHISQKNENKNTSNDIISEDVEENKSTHFVSSDFTQQKYDDLLVPDISMDEVDINNRNDPKNDECVEKEDECQCDVANETLGIEEEDNIFISTIKENSIFKCELFKPDITSEYSNSCLVTDMVISPHSRYVTLTKNIRKRRGTKVISFNEIYKDVNTENMDIWKLSLDKNDKRLFKKKLKKTTLDGHLIWNKSMTNEKKKSEKKNIIKNDETELLDKVIKHSLFSNIDDDEDYIYSYNREFIEEYSKKCKNPIKNYVYLDAMFFGMSMCCQQITMSFQTINDAKYVYDQLAVIAPLFLAITACTPYLGGFLTETDARWRVISNSVDCRTEDELSYISKPRYSGISLYISDELPLKKNYYFYNDIDIILNKNVYDKLIKENVDEYLSRHISSLFVRDPIVVFEGSFSEKDITTIQNIMHEKNENINNSKMWSEEEMNKIYLSDDFEFLEDYKEKVLSSHQHFENFQSTNWNSVRFKPPPILDNNYLNGPSSIGWRVEFRTPDIQITDFENASVVALIMTLSKFILKKKLNLYIPMSKLEENLFRSSKRDAILKEKFYFRNDINYDTCNNEIEEKSIYDIFFNKNNGILYLCSLYIEEQFEQGLISLSAKNKINEYIQFIKLRCKGEICTGASFLRKFILNHSAYEQNSYINNQINYDLCKLISDIGKGEIAPHELLGGFVDPHKERIKNNLRQISKRQYLKSLAYKFISGEDYTQYLLLNEDLKHDKDFFIQNKHTNYEESDEYIDNNMLEFGKKLYQFSA
ncbi:gamma-glutamylcysteine synthetase [Plasmodium berghei]|uniref:glutamate--cysteine ligase n=2 Tax=Plasmodium berghei TaxID=5821 RepID=A0A509AJ34_PLABA|nr:gamma-glutamylcysteine synthetase [Plasmodium berghei ANKA]CXI33220.1 gamma-glutamylcysteine synthetase [Plasmodium berghei]SCM21235.1 gamma-glutamylcysteine synthetase [Plasmodium berghei]SCN24537.1 gamma-glutamylcysteine synthetase [Plasmodium berghei]SCO59715.1 gamma-glutamylcysteine synthetase [Plasmodium berghei]SCO60929.1 gamma-glutamylcysteine synthetase [Plasmodium berghei]|eukprot:XP_034421170.1 gamma-glutamylcysteine synthetase [Plasmodium berghei ANKA]